MKNMQRGPFILCLIIMVFVILVFGSKVMEARKPAPIDYDYPTRTEMLVRDEIIHSAGSNRTEIIRDSGASYKMATSSSNRNNGPIPVLEPGRQNAVSVEVQNSAGSLQK